MPFQRYKPWKVFGRYNTLTFKFHLRNKNECRLPPLQIDPELEKSKVVIHDPTRPEFFQRMLKTEQYYYEKPAHLSNRRIEDHELYKPQRAYLFDGSNSMTDGVDQACSLINATSAQRLPVDFFVSNLPSDFLPHDFEEHVRDAIMHGERYDATLEPLPRRFDPIIWWMQYPPLCGTPVVKRAMVILADLVRKVLMLSATRDSTRGGDKLRHLRLDRDSPISAFLPSANSGLGMPWVLRQQPGLVLHSMGGALPLMADHATVEKTRFEEVPDIYPISPLVDLPSTNIYNDHSLLPRLSLSHAHLNCIFSTREQNQKYPWSRDENAANAILHCFGAAVAQATRLGEIKLERPVVMKAVQLIDGRMDLVLVQVNTLQLRNNTRRAVSATDTEKTGDVEVKNLVWLEKSLPLYKPKPYYENMDEVRELDVDTAKKFASFMLYQ